MIDGKLKSEPKTAMNTFIVIPNALIPPGSPIFHGRAGHSGRAAGHGAPLGHGGLLRDAAESLLRSNVEAGAFVGERTSPAPESVAAHDDDHIRWMQESTRCSLCRDGSRGIDERRGASATA